MEKKVTTFNSWMRENTAKLTQRLNLYHSMDEDAFQDAYLTLAEAYNSKENSETFELAFLATYNRLSLMNLGYTLKTTHPDELFFTLLPFEVAEPEEHLNKDRNQDLMVKKVKKHIRTSFQPREVMAFEMRMKGFSYRDIADTFGVGSTTITNLIDGIIEHTRLQFNLATL